RAVPREALERGPVQAHLGSFPGEAAVTSPRAALKRSRPRRGMPAVRATDQGGGGVRSRERRGKRSMRRAWAGGRIKQSGQSALRSRQDFDDPVEREIAAFSVLDIRKVALAKALRQRSVGSLPERSPQVGAR